MDFVPSFTLRTGAGMVIFMEEIQVEKYKQEIESMLPLCEYNRIKTKYLNKSTLIGKKLILIKKEEHKKYTQPYFVLWIAVVSDAGLQTTDNAGKSIAITLSQSQQNIDFYNSIQAGDVFVISQYKIKNMTGYSYQVVQHANNNK